MEKFFNVYIEFDRQKVDTIIHSTIVNNGKGYVCSVEGNVISIANTNSEYLNIVNNALVNICDGNSIAFLTSLIHIKKNKTYIGADLFIKYIKNTSYKSYFLGSNDDILDGLRHSLTQYNPNIQHMIFQSLPFRKVEEFDYEAIAKMINMDNPDIIWVSLGAPKQEEFMHHLQPYLNRGVMFGFGAIFNFYSLNSNEKRAPKFLLKLKMEWIYRFFQHPKKQFPRIKQIFLIYPRLIIDEIKLVRQEKREKKRLENVDNP